MNAELRKTLLIELRNLINSSIKHKSAPHRELEEVLAKNYKLPEGVHEKIIELVSGSERLKAENNEEVDEQIRALISYLGLKPRRYDETNLDYERLKTLVNNKISQLNKEMK